MKSLDEILHQYLETSSSLENVPLQTGAEAIRHNWANPQKGFIYQVMNEDHQ